FQLKGQFPEKMCFVAGTSLNGKANIVVMLSNDLVEKGLHAGNLVRQAAKFIQGGGGGQPHFATAGGKNIDGLVSAVEWILKNLE
ncbi:MAG TPA: DHHA1 domain-containing protein, partial [Paludibacteraceae bacterium]|nr:DHHA1 domain-containing protein [Paludibacteraceae bacterium]